MSERTDLVYDWNAAGPEGWPKPARKIEFDDETLRDGLQSPSVVTPTVDERVRILHLMDAMGLDSADIGLPGAGGVVKSDTLELAKAMQRDKLRIAANCAARTVEADVRPIVEIVQATGRPIEACLFIGSSPIRQYAENWTSPRTRPAPTRRTSAASTSPRSSAAPSGSASATPAATRRPAAS